MAVDVRRHGEDPGVIVVAGTIDLADPAARQGCLAGSIPFQDATRREEPGCLAYCFAADPLVEGRIQVYELWADEASLAAHFQHRNYLNMRSHLMGQGLRAADNRKYLVARAAPVYDDTGRPRADFEHADDPSAAAAAGGAAGGEG